MMSRKVDLVLVNPGNRLEQYSELNTLATVGPPLGIGMVASFVRQHGITVDIVDAEAHFWNPDQTIEFLKKEYDPILIGLTAFTTKMTAAGRIMRLVKEHMPGVKTMLGGHHASAIPGHTLQNEAVDFVLQGEGYQPIVELVRRLKQGDRSFRIPGIWYKEGDQIVDNGAYLNTHDLDELPMVAWDLLPMHAYRAHHWQAWDYDLDTSRFAMIYTSLGCAFACNFCSVNVVYGSRRVRFRSPRHLVEELKLLVHHYGIRHVEVVDDTFTIHRKRVEEVCDAIIEAGLGSHLNMWCFGRTDTVTPSLMEKMKRAGFNWVFMGFESGNDDILQSVNKKQNTDKIKQANDIVRASGIRVGGNYIFGHQMDTLETMQDTLNLAMDLNVEYANFFLTMPYPGTSLYHIARERGYPLPERWGQYGFFAQDAMPMRNANLSSWDIIQFRDYAFKKYYHGERYQAMLKEVFGEKVLQFMREKVLAKDMLRASPTAEMKIGSDGQVQNFLQNITS